MNQNFLKSILLIILSFISCIAPAFSSRKTDRLLKETDSKSVCLSPTSMLNWGPLDLVCTGRAKLKIIRATSGLQSTELCPQIRDPHVNSIRSCHESKTTTQIIAKKCNNQKSCKIDLSEPFPHTCESDIYSYLNIIYKCVRDKAPDSF